MKQFPLTFSLLAHVLWGCVNAARKAIKLVDGVTSDTLKAHENSFKVEGDFKAKAEMEALAKAGFTGKVEN